MRRSFDLNITWIKAPNAKSDCPRKSATLLAVGRPTRGRNGWKDDDRDLAVILGAVVNSSSSCNTKECHIPQSAIVEVDGHCQSCQESIEWDLHRRLADSSHSTKFMLESVTSLARKKE